MRHLAPLLLVAALLGGCGDDTAPVPDGVAFRLEQTRQDLQNRNISVQVLNDGRSDLTVERVELVSGRLDEPATYVGPARVAAGTAVNLVMEMPRARCGRGLDARVRVTYAVGDDETVTSVARPSDRFGSVGRFMKRDCAERAVGRIEIDGLTVRGASKEAELVVALTVTPPRSGSAVRLDHVEGSTLLAPADPDATSIDREVRPGGDPVRAELTFVPNRCDVHVVAEDRTGGILPMRVEGGTFGRSPVYLTFSEPQKAQIFDYLAERCGFGEVRDPLNAP